ncbi:MAG: dephospho-CoA kinase [Actinomycetota bacterium]
MLLVGLTGGIGSGKSTVARMLVERGAVVLDADAFSREALAPGTPGFDQVLERFGEGLRTADGSLDRVGLAAQVFSDPVRLRELESIVHPVVREAIASGAAAHRDSDAIVVIDSPLLIEMEQHDDVDLLVVVTAPDQIQVRRMVESRGFAEEDVRRRLAVQLPLEDKAEQADVVLDNGGTLHELERQVERLWRDLQVRAATEV